MSPDVRSVHRPDALAVASGEQQLLDLVAQASLGVDVHGAIEPDSFALNQWLQYREVGPWRSYAFGERAYLVLSLVAKSALAWQIYGGSLAS